LAVTVSTRTSARTPIRPPKGLPGAPPPTPPRFTRRRIIEFVVIFVGCVLLLDALVGERGLIVMMRAAEDNRLLEQELERWRADNEQLRVQRNRLLYDREAIEDAARQKLGLIKPGEKLFTVHDIEPPAK
jgi:cell division protein FtsB